MGAAAALALAVAACGERLTGGQARVLVPPGASVAQVAESLRAHRLIEHPRVFRLLARAKGVDRSLKAGLYAMPVGASMATLLRILREGRTVTVKVTIPEGLMLGEMAELVERELGLPADSFLAAAGDSGLRARVGAMAPTLEGFLRPETYVLPAEISARGLVRVLAEGFHEGWQAGWDARLLQLGLSRAELVTLASIVEKEAVVPSERPVIAGVYLNRIRQGMPLQADPTVQYAMARETGRWKGRLLLRDYKYASPYNTYLIRGLPPGPICSPGMQTIEATLFAADVPWLFFVARADGRHQFSRTYREHLRAIAESRRERDSLARLPRDTVAGAPLRAPAGTASTQ